VIEENNLADEDAMRMIQYLMSATKLKTRISGTVGEEFGTISGIPQGDALSPILFAVYLEWIMRKHRERYPSRGVSEDFTLQYADDTKMFFHARTTQIDHGPHVSPCECVRCIAERISKVELPESFAEGDMKLNADKTKYGALDAVHVPKHTKFVGSYLDPSEEVAARVTAANKAHYTMRTIMNKESGVSKKLKLRLYNAIVKPTLIYNLWTIPLKKAQRDWIDRTHRRHLRSLMGRYYKEDEPMVSCQEIYLETDTVPITVELAERRWALLGHILRLPGDTPANRAMGQYFRKTFAGGVRRETYAGAQVTSVMSMLRDEYRDHTTARMKREVGTSKFLHGADLDKFTNYAQDREAWEALVNHITHRTKMKWVKKDAERKGREVPWSSTPVIRVRADDVRITRREAVAPRLLTFDEGEEKNEE